MEITIQQWLSNPKRKYSDGVLLYDKYGSNGVFKILFHSEESEYNSEKIFELLTDLAPAKTDNSVTKVIPLIIDKPEKDIPEIVTKTFERAMRLHKEAGQLHARLPLFVTNEERLKAALEILDNGDERYRCWSFYDHYIETGELLIVNDIEKEDFSNKSKADLILIKQRLMVQRSKLRKKIDAGGSEEKVTLWRDKLLITEEQLAEVEKILDGPII